MRHVCAKNVYLVSGCHHGSTLLCPSTGTRHGTRQHHESSQNGVVHAGREHASTERYEHVGHVGSGSEGCPHAHGGLLSVVLVRGMFTLQHVSPRDRLLFALPARYCAAPTPTHSTATRSVHRSTIVAATRRNNEYRRMAEWRKAEQAVLVRFGYTGVAVQAEGPHAMLEAW